MPRKRDYFKKINFDKPWEEDDWELFFQAQETLLRELGPATGAYKDRVFSSRAILRRLRLQADHGPAPAPPSGGSGEEFWREGAAPDSLPSFRLAETFRQDLRLLYKRLGRRLYKKYESPAHAQAQRLLHRMAAHAAQAPRELALGHELGYEPEGVKGNIARCKRALAHADHCLGCLSRLPARRLPAGEHRRLFQEAAAVRNALSAWIAFLREHFVRVG
ncbi:MAG: hypothetical protein ACT4O3_08595 [Elusimicrobiota bacterium]|jgi:hypothetical protein